WRYYRSAWGMLPAGLLTFSLGLLWASFAADRVVSEKLDSSMNRERCIIQGSIDQVDQQAQQLTRFTLAVETLSCGGVTVQQVRRTRLSWYRPDHALLPGEQWRMAVRLKRPHGFANPGLFDYSAWLAQRHIGATGYVDSADPPERIAVDQYALATWRARLVTQLGNQLTGHPQTGIIGALALGDRTAISDQQWQVIRASGTSHLLAISGLHIGLVGALFWWLGSGLWRYQSRGLVHLPAPLAGALVGWMAALGYALLSGFAVPAQRAMIMFTVLVVATWLRREPFSRRSFLIALVLVLLWEPLAVQQAGFWLSFTALAIIGWCLVGRQTGSRWWRLLQIQLALWLALTPLVMLFFDQQSLVSLPANLVAIPLVTLVVLPLSLLGVALMMAIPAVAAWLLVLAARAMDITWRWLEWITRQGDSLIAGQPSVLAVSNPWVALLATAGLLWLLAPRGMPARWLGLGCLIPIFSPLFVTAGYPQSSDFDSGIFESRVVDVGQGLAVIVTTANHLLVYDVGARFSDRFDAGADLLVPLVAPLLRERGMQAISRVVISHGDSDHAGGLPGLLAGISVLRVDSGTPNQLAERGIAAVSPCRSGEQWVWDGVLFEYLHQPTLASAADNDRSCVLRVGGASGLLLPGDLGIASEQRLMQYLGSQNQLDKLQAQVLLIPHHGSRNASSRAFIETVAPQLAVASSGYANRFNHPHPITLERYQRAQVKVVTTAQVGAVMMRFDRQGLRNWSGQRSHHQRYWH
ncbi:MAG: DNA internalization-related competence protein ComEC/Rec2, partial [Gammaproteobacteria bacterium]